MLVYQFMNAKNLYRIIFIGNEPYRNHRKELNNLKHQAHQFGAELQEDDYWNILMLDHLVEPMQNYVRKSISGVFKILISKISESELEFQNLKTSEVEIFRNRNSEHP